MVQVQKIIRTLTSLPSRPETQSPEKLVASGSVLAGSMPAISATNTTLTAGAVVHNALLPYEQRSSKMLTCYRNVILHIFDSL